MVSRIFYYTERLFVIHTEYPPFACFRCPSERCCDETLVGSVEFRCFKEVVSSWGKMVFDGSIKRINCITEHKDYDAITNGCTCSSCSVTARQVGQNIPASWRSVRKRVSAF